MKEAILVTAIGSLSSDAIVSSLNKHDEFEVYGSDIFPSHWHVQSLNLKKVFHVPRASDPEKYIERMLEICMDYSIKCILPLTDIEVDVYNLYREDFEKKDITICISGDQSIKIARDKYLLSSYFDDNEFFQPILSHESGNDLIKDPVYPYVAKPKNGRSSEGLFIIYDEVMLKYIISKDNYIIQPFIEGNIYTVDYIRDPASGNDYSFSREELLRTTNGAGLTVRLLNDATLNQAASYIGNTLNIKGCVNIEFIKADEGYYLTDINPRFSAGIGFTIVGGYDIVKNHLNCFRNIEIEKPGKYPEMIITKSYSETIMVRK